MKTIETYQVTLSQGILLNANECGENLPLTVREEIAQAALDLAYNRYPDDECKELLNAYAKVMNLSTEQLIAGNGSDELLGLLISVLAANKSVLTLDPDFSMYDYYASVHQAELLRFQHDLHRPFDLDAFIQMGKKVDLILFSNPNNPSGTALSAADLCQLVEAAAPIPVIIDEAYAEFNDESMVDKLAVYENLILTRTLSKAYGLAGLRVGFAISNPAMIQRLKAAKVPYNVNSFSQRAASIVLKHNEIFAPRTAQIVHEREKMLAACQSLKHFTVYPSKANFIYFRSKRKAVFMSLLDDIKIRDYSDDGFRITIGSPDQNERIISLLRQADKEIL